MVRVTFTPALKRFYPDLKALEIEAGDVASLLDTVDSAHPGLRAYLVDDRGALRQHVNIFIGEDLIRDKVALSDSLSNGDEVYIMQALSGG